MESMITLAGLYEWDKTIFSGFTAPTVITSAYDNQDAARLAAFTFDSTNYINRLLIETMNLEILYPDPAAFKRVFDIWYATQYQKYCELLTTQYYKYNPIWNKDSSITDEENTAGFTEKHSGAYTESITRQDKHSQSDTRTIAETGSDTDTETHSGTDGTVTNNTTETRIPTQQVSETYGANEVNTHEVSAFNSTDYQASERDTKTIPSKTVTTTPVTGAADGSEHLVGSINLTHGEQITTTQQKGTTTTDSTVYGHQIDGTETKTITDTRQTDTDIDHTQTHTETGNIGVQTTQQMIQEQRTLVMFNLYELMISDFKLNFCVLIY